MTDILRLDHLSLSDLNNLVSAVVGLKEAGYLMREQGFEPSFSLVPGFALQMRLDYRMPLTGPIGAGVQMADPDPLPVSIPPVQSDDDAQVTLLRKAADKPVLRKASPFPTPAQIEAAVNAACDKVLPNLPAHAAEPAHSVAKAEITVIEPAAEPAPPPEPVAEPARAEPSSARPAPWTDEEDAKLVYEVAKRMALDQMGKSAAAAEVAAMLGRPIAGTECRLHTKLKSALKAAIDGLTGVGPTTVADPAPIADPVLRGAPADPVPMPEPAPQPPLTAATLSPIEQHLLDMPTKGGWTLETDLDLLELSQNGWTIPEIATEMGRDGRAVTERFDLLTGWDRETKTRKWNRSALLIAAREWAAKRAPASAAE